MECTRGGRERSVERERERARARKRERERERERDFKDQRKLMHFNLKLCAWSSAERQREGAGMGGQLEKTSRRRRDRIFSPSRSLLNSLGTKSAEY